MFLKHNTQFASIRTISVSEQFARNNYIFLNYLNCWKKGEKNLYDNKMNKEQHCF